MNRGLIIKTLREQAGFTLVIALGLIAVEVIPTEKTSQDTMDTAVSFVESIRKLPVRVKECAGFLVNRLLMPYVGEAIWCYCVLGAGASPTDDLRKAISDHVAQRLGGPFRPGAVKFVSEIPKTRNAKVLRRAVRAAYTPTSA